MQKKTYLDTFKVVSNPKYRGKHLVMIEGKIFALNTSKEAKKVFDKVTKTYPGKIPTIAYIPKADTLILWL